MLRLRALCRSATHPRRTRGPRVDKEEPEKEGVSDERRGGTQNGITVRVGQILSDWSFQHCLGLWKRMRGLRADGGERAECGGVRCAVTKTVVQCDSKLRESCVGETITFWSSSCTIGARARLYISVHMYECMCSMGEHHQHS